jgi:hypothetical protein
MSRTRDGRVTSYTITIRREGPFVIFVSPQYQQLKEQRYKITRKIKGLYCEEDSELVSSCIRIRRCFLWIDLEAYWLPDNK